MKIAPIIYLIGMLLCILSLFMMIPALVDWFYGNDDWPAFVGSSFITLFVGSVCFLRALRGRDHGRLQPAPGRPGPAGDESLEPGPGHCLYGPLVCGDSLDQPAHGPEAQDPGVGQDHAPRRRGGACT